MAVAVKNAPETSSPGLLDRLPVQCFLGTLYVVASIIVALQGLATLWYDYLGFDRGLLLSWAGLLNLRLAVAAGLAVLGYRLLGPRPTPGVKAGTFVGVIAVGVALLLAWWAGIWLQHWSLDRDWFPRTVGVALNAVVLVALFGLIGWAFFQPSVQRRLVQLEELGWFSFASYKRSQGVKVRRGTILGVLAIAIPGIYILADRQLKTGPINWEVNIPFTGAVTVTDPGDAGAVLGKLDEGQKDRVRVLTPGDWQDVQKAGAVLPRSVYEEERQKFGDAVKVTDPGSARFEGDAVLNVYPLIVTRQAFDAAKERIEKEGGKPPQGTAPKLPRVGTVLDPYVLRDVNKRLQEQYVKVSDPGDTDYQQGQVVPRDEFDAERSRAEKEARQDREVKEALARAKEKEEKGEDPAEDLARAQSLIDQKLPKAAPDGPEPASGETDYRRVTLLPVVMYSVPVLLLAAALWFTWRLVNVPAFADFLIATEAELNKVSWTTRRRLVQDTIVVLVTVVLMTAFLLFADVIWSQSLRWVGVL
ncbi:MAG TPA: preprotein translocase subunit SecE, partial [Gemmataceae bacterium]|nr:preprotein translocase subunit SecE [Gemmataceae bacterium]